MKRDNLPFLFNFLFILSLLSAVRPAWSAVDVLTEVESGKMVETVTWIQPNQHVRLVLKNNIPNHWFLFALKGVQNKTLTIEVVGQNTIHHSFPWKGVQPLIADSLDLSDPVLYDEVAYKQQYDRLPWRRIENATYDEQKRTMTMQVHFDRDVATIALKYPCPVSYVDQRVQELSNQLGPTRIGIYTAGTTVEGRSLQIVAIPGVQGANAQRWKEKPTILLYGGEHATEHESSQVVMGALEWLLSDENTAQAFVRDYNVLLVPHLSADDTVNSVFGRISDGFTGTLYKSGPENDTWAKFWDGYIENGFRLDVSVDIHNVGGSESPNFFAPVIQSSQAKERPMAEALHKSVMAQFKEQTPSKDNDANKDLIVDTTMKRYGNYVMRLMGWQTDSFGVRSAFYEVNGQYPAKRLSLTQLRFIGVGLLKGIKDFINQPLFAQQRNWQMERLAQRSKRKREVLAGWNPQIYDDPPEWFIYNKAW